MMGKDETDVFNSSFVPHPSSFSFVLIIFRTDFLLIFGFCNFTRKMF